MTHLKNFGACLFLLSLLVTAESAQASHRGRGPYPVTLCGPGLAYFCPLRGFFDATPFHYNLAIYPGCIKWVTVDTPYGPRRQRVLVCG